MDLASLRVGHRRSQERLEQRNFFFFFFFLEASLETGYVSMLESSSAAILRRH